MSLRMEPRSAPSPWRMGVKATSGHIIPHLVGGLQMLEDMIGHAGYAQLPSYTAPGSTASSFVEPHSKHALEDKANQEVSTPLHVAAEAGPLRQPPR